MAGSPEPRRRADAERSRAAILDAATRLLATGPCTGGLAAIATAAGVTRQTVYAHFSSREELFAAVTERITAETVAAMAAADLDSGSATDALLRILELGWRSFEAHPVLRRLPPTEPDESRELHNPVTDHLLRLLRRGQRAGEFDSAATPEWLAAAIIAVSHAAGEEVGAERMTPQQAERSLRASVLRLVGADPVAGG